MPTEGESQDQRCLVAFVVPVRNDAIRLARCLASIRATAGPDASIIVMDHGSVDGSADVALAAGARVVGAGRDMPNVAALRNQGAGLADTPFVAFIDADHEVAPTWLASALAAAGDSHIGAVGAPYHPPQPGTWVQQWYDALRRHPAAVEPAEWFGAGNLLVRRDAFTAVGGFDLTLEASEDVDLCHRLARAGWRLLNVPGMRCIHHGDPATLTHLFRQELWRGRDNLRVSLRQRPLTFRNVVSAGVPAMVVAALPAMGLGLLAQSPAGHAVALVAAGVVVGVTSLRAVSMLARRGWARWASAPRALAVAATYDAARALALVVHAGHHRRAPAARPA